MENEILMNLIVGIIGVVAVCAMVWLYVGKRLEDKELEDLD